MSERNLSRRSLLRAGATGLAALPAISAILPQEAAAEAKASAGWLSPEQAVLIEQIRVLKAKVDRLVSIEMSLETRKGKPGYRKYRRARTAAYRAEEELTVLTADLLERPAKNWGDVAVIAELAVAHAERTIEGGFVLIDEGGPLGDHALGALMLAARSVGGAHV